MSISGDVRLVGQRVEAEVEWVIPGEPEMPLERLDIFAHSICVVECNGACRAEIYFLRVI
jgi:hypothetical protein